MAKKVNSFKNRLIIKLVNYLRKKQKLSPSSNQRICIFSTTGLGDTLWATPVIRQIKKENPSSYICIFTTNLGNQLFLNNPYVDKVISLKKPFLFYFIPIYQKLLREQIDTVLLYHVSQRAIIFLSFLINAKNIISTKGTIKDLDVLLTKSYEKQNNHEIDRRYDISSTFLNNKRQYSLDFFLTDLEKKKHQYLKNNKKYLIAIHPGAKDFYKCWPKERFLQLLLSLQNKFPCEFVITGTKNEDHILMFLSKNTQNSIVFNNLNIRELASLFSICDLVVSNDSGPMHLANSINKKQVALFAPTDPKNCGPKPSQNVTIIKKEKTCDNCLKRKCNKKLCLKQIQVNEVLDACINLLTEKL
jgi:ADP-heptose:LPS heptosyltransferase